MIRKKIKTYLGLRCVAMHLKPLPHSCCSCCVKRKKIPRARDKSASQALFVVEVVVVCVHLCAFVWCYGDGGGGGSHTCKLVQHIYIDKSKKTGTQDASASRAPSLIVVMVEHYGDSGHMCILFFLNKH